MEHRYTINGGLSGRGAAEAWQAHTQPVFKPYLLTLMLAAFCGPEMASEVS